MIGNGLTPLINAACLQLERVVKLVKTTNEINANKGKSRPVAPPTLNCVFYEDI
jgi:hypothetical protein